MKVSKLGRGLPAALEERGQARLPDLELIKLRLSMQALSAHTTGVAVFLFGLKKGVFTTVAWTGWRTASTVISN
jgi:hypothetical protein